MPLFGHKSSPSPEARRRVLKALQRGPGPAEFIEARLAEEGLPYDHAEDFRVEDILKFLQREGRVEAAAAGGRRVYMLTGEGLRELLELEVNFSCGAAGGVTGVVLEELVTAVASWPVQDTPP